MSIIHTQFLELALKAQYILLSGPKGLDGDSIGACLALKALLQQQGCHNIDIAGTLSFRYSWLPDASSCIPDCDIESQYDLVVILDGDRHRLTPTVQKAFEKARHTAVIDHHQSSSNAGYDLALLDPQASSTCTMIFEMAHTWGCTVNIDIATQLYAGLVFDTGAFRYQNTTPETFKLASALIQTGINHPEITTRILAERRAEGVQLLAHVLSKIQFYNEETIAYGQIRLADFTQMNCIEEDIEGIVEQLLFITGIELACLCIEKSDSAVKISLRSRRQINVATLAQSISPHGGGHVRAAGAFVPMNFDLAKPFIHQKLLAAFSS